jgi:hypothetical protein
VERDGRRGQMSPLHARDMDETYRVLEGEVLFFIGPETVAAGPGDIVVAPAGVPRTFTVLTGVARWLVLTRVESLERFVDFGRAVSQAVASDEWPSEDEHASLAAMAAANGIELIGPPGSLPDGPFLT